MKCLVANNGSEGIEIFRKNSTQIKVVILDVEMPGLSGENVFRALREISPGVKVLIASGYGKEYLETTRFKCKIEHFLPKPFNIEQLSYQINRLLGGKNV
jgi:YesN/AraC family two-component response regulator